MKSSSLLKRFYREPLSWLKNLYEFYKEPHVFYKDPYGKPKGSL
jgi:hypothetical protein